MTRALFHKQMMEVFSLVYQNRKTGKNRSKRGIISYVLLYLLIFGFLGVIFFLLADTLCEPLISFGFGWMYMALMGLISLALGVFGSVFNTFASLYQAKDNDLLLSMPISPSPIMTKREAIIWLGAGKKRAETKPARQISSQISSMPMMETTLTQWG